MHHPSSTATKRAPASTAHQAQIDRVLGLVTHADYKRLEDSLRELFGLHYRTVSQHPFNIKSIIKGKSFAFSEGQHLSSRTFVILHSVGHYYFISRAHEMNYGRYEYIYDKKESQGALRGHDEALVRTTMHDPQRVTDKMRRDRVAFEVGANNYAFSLLEHIGMRRLAEVVNVYQPGDINYILDVTAGGKDAIVHSDDEYLERYICSGLTYEEEKSNEKIYDPASFRVDGIDWKYLDDIELEVHFF